MRSCCCRGLVLGACPRPGRHAGGALNSPAALRQRVQILLHPARTDPLPRRALEAGASSARRLAVRRSVMCAEPRARSRPKSERTRPAVPRPGVPRPGSLAAGCVDPPDRAPICARAGRRGRVVGRLCDPARKLGWFGGMALLACLRVGCGGYLRLRRDRSARHLFRRSLPGGLGRGRAALSKRRGPEPEPTRSAETAGAAKTAGSQGTHVSLRRCCSAVPACVALRRSGISLLRSGSGPICCFLYSRCVPNRDISDK